MRFKKKYLHLFFIVLERVKHLIEEHIVVKFSDFENKFSSNCPKEPDFIFQV